MLWICLVYTSPSFCLWHISGTFIEQILIEYHIEFHWSKTHNDTISSNNQDNRLTWRLSWIIWKIICIPGNIRIQMFRCPKNENYNNCFQRKKKLQQLLLWLQVEKLVIGFMYTVWSKRFRTDFFKNRRHMKKTHIRFLIQNKLNWNIHRFLRSHTVSEKMLKIPLFGPS